MTITDALGRKITVPAIRRIVSLVPSLTELLHDLGMDREIVGITKYCVYPPHYRLQKTIVGGTKKVNYRKIENLHPDIILCNKEENTREMVSGLDKIAPVYVSDVSGYESALTLIKELGIILNRRTEAQKIIQKTEHAKKELEKAVRDEPVLKSIYFIWANPYMAAGSDTFISDMMRKAKLHNALENDTRYPEINIKTMRFQYKPDVLLFSSEPYDFKDEDVYEIMRYNRKTPALFVDGSYFIWYGSRMAKAFEYFRTVRQKLKEQAY